MLSSSRTIKTLLLTLASLFVSSCASAPSKPQLRDAAISEDAKFKAANIGISIDGFNALGFALGDSCDVSFSNGYSLTDVPYYNGYYVKNGDPIVVAYPSNEYLSVTLSNIGIWDVAGLSEEYTVTITLNEPKKYLATQEALGQSYSLDREKYSSDEEFSNFRSLKGGNLKENLLYRGASPVDNSRKRAKCTDGLLEKNGIACIIDLADSKEDMGKYISSDDFSSSYAKSLYENDQMVLLSMGASYASDVYKQKVVEGCRYMLSHDGPYYIHCMEGKDRTGFVCMLFEALAGASYEEMCADYMQTYKNYYQISAEGTPTKYAAVVSLYFDSFMECLRPDEDISSWKTASYIEPAKEYLQSGGMNEQEIDRFVALLSA